MLDFRLMFHFFFEITILLYLHLIRGDPTDLALLAVGGPKQTCTTAQLSQIHVMHIMKDR